MSRLNNKDIVTISKCLSAGRYSINQLPLLVRALSTGFRYEVYELLKDDALMVDGLRMEIVAEVWEDLSEIVREGRFVDFKHLRMTLLQIAMEYIFGVAGPLPKDCSYDLLRSVFARSQHQLTSSDDGLYEVLTVDDVCSGHRLVFTDDRRTEYWKFSLIVDSNVVWTANTTLHHQHKNR